MTIWHKPLNQMMRQKWYNISSTSARRYRKVDILKPLFGVNCSGKCHIHCYLVILEKYESDRHSIPIYSVLKL